MASNLEAKRLIRQGELGDPLAERILGVGLRQQRTDGGEALLHGQVG